MDPVEYAGAILGLACVWLTVRQSLWCWPTGIAMVCLYWWVFDAARLYSDRDLQVVYLFLQVYGWWHWVRGGGRGAEAGALPVARLGRGSAFAWVGAVAAGTLLLGWWRATRSDAALPYGDAFTTVLSLAAQWLMGRKVLESWLGWIVVDAVSIGIYGMQGLYPTMVLYAAFLGMATAGWFAWRRSMAERRTASGPAAAG